MKYAIVGSRGFAKLELVAKALDALRAGDPGLEIVSGGADGPDTEAQKWAEKNGVPCTVHAADWDADGDKAGIKRNGKIVEDSQGMLAFWDGESPGTLDSICRGKKRKDYPVAVYLA